MRTAHTWTVTMRCRTCGDETSHLLAAVSLIVLIRRISAAQQARIARGVPTPSGTPVRPGTPVPSGPAGYPVPQPVTTASPQVPADGTVASPQVPPAAGGTIRA